MASRHPPARRAARRGALSLTQSYQLCLGRRRKERGRVKTKVTERCQAFAPASYVASQLLSVPLAARGARALRRRRRAAWCLRRLQRSLTSSSSAVPPRRVGRATVRSAVCRDHEPAGSDAAELQQRAGQMCAASAVTRRAAARVRVRRVRRASAARAAPPRAPSPPRLPAVGCAAGIEDLREKREEVNRSIAKDEEEKGTPAPRTGQSGGSRSPATTRWYAVKADAGIARRAAAGAARYACASSSCAASELAPPPAAPTARHMRATTLAASPVVRAASCTAGHSPPRT